MHVGRQINHHAGVICDEQGFGKCDMSKNPANKSVAQTAAKKQKSSPKQNEASLRRLFVCIADPNAKVATTSSDEVQNGFSMKKILKQVKTR